MVKKKLWSSGVRVTASFSTAEEVREIIPGTVLMYDVRIKIHQTLSEYTCTRYILQVQKTLMSL